jgi:membrane-associated protease RseP (regulator of RpoE activity)
VSDVVREEEPTLEDARAFSGRRLTGLVLVLAAIVVACAYYHQLGALAVVAAIVAMIVLHEFGHFLTARLSGMKVSEFFLGFGPRVWSVRVGETEYGVKALLVGGYVKIAGMTNLEEVPPEDESRTYREASFPRRVLVSVAGSLMHFLIAFAILWVIFSGLGVLTGARGTLIASVARFRGYEPPAAAAGIPPGAVVVDADGHHDPSLAMFERLVEGSTGKPVRLVLRVHGRLIERTVTPVSSRTLARYDPAYRAKRPVGVIGVGIEAAAPIYTRVSLPSGAWHALIGVGSYAWTSVRDVVDHFTPHGIITYVHEVVHPSSNPNSARAQSRFVSVVGIAEFASYAASAGVVDVLTLLFLINVFVGVFNLFPFLPLDGGHVVVAIYERIRSRKGRRYHADVMKLLPITYAVLVVIILLGITSVYLDLTHPIPNPFG